VLKNKHFKRWLPLSDAKHTDSSNITHLNEDFGQESPWIFWDMSPFDQINGRHGRKQIKQLRKRLGISIPGFAQKIGVNRTMAWSYESGRSSPSQESSAGMIGFMNLHS